MAFCGKSKSTMCTIYINGNIYTVAGIDWDTQPQRAMVIKDGIIEYVGSNEDAKEFYEEGNSKIYDLEGATVLPGIHDVHMHPLEAGSEVGGTCELPKDTSPEDMIRLIMNRKVPTGF